MKKQRKLKFSDFFHDEEILKELYSVEHIDHMEKIGLLGDFLVDTFPGNSATYYPPPGPLDDYEFFEIEAQNKAAVIAKEMLLGYLITTYGEAAVLEYLKAFDSGIYSLDEIYPEIERELPFGPINLKALKELPDVTQAIQELPIRDAIVQLKILSTKPYVTPGFLRRYRSKSKSVSFKEPFAYSLADLSLNSKGVISFRLPVSPEELLLLGAQENSLVSIFAYQDKLPSEVVLMFDSSNNYLGFIELDKATQGILNISFSEHAKQELQADDETYYSSPARYYGHAIKEWAHAVGLPGLAFRRYSFWMDSIRIEVHEDIATRMLYRQKDQFMTNLNIFDDLYYE